MAEGRRPPFLLALTQQSDVPPWLRLPHPGYVPREPEPHGEPVVRARRTGRSSSVVARNLLRRARVVRPADLVASKRGRGTARRSRFGFEAYVDEVGRMRVTTQTTAHEHLSRSLVAAWRAPRDSASANDAAAASAGTPAAAPSPSRDRRDRSRHR